jgi:hypothetical protein
VGPDYQDETGKSIDLTVSFGVSGADSPRAEPIVTGYCERQVWGMKTSPRGQDSMAVVSFESGPLLPTIG